jgi:hypothetical protein
MIPYSFTPNRLRFHYENWSSYLAQLEIFVIGKTS